MGTISVTHKGLLLSSHHTPRLIVWTKLRSFDLYSHLYAFINVLQMRQAALWTAFLCIIWYIKFCILVYKTMSPHISPYHNQLKPSGMVLSIEQLLKHIYVNNWPSFVQVMVCRRLGIKLLSELMMYFQFSFRTNFSEILIEIKKFLFMSWKCISKLSFANCQPYFSGVIVLHHHPNSTHRGSNEQWVTWSSPQPWTVYLKLGQIAKRGYTNHVTMQSALPHSSTIHLLNSILTQHVPAYMRQLMLISILFSITQASGRFLCSTYFCVLNRQARFSHLFYI